MMLFGRNVVPFLESSAAGVEAGVILLGRVIAIRINQHRNKQENKGIANHY